MKFNPFNSNRKPKKNENFNQEKRKPLSQENMTRLFKNNQGASDFLKKIQAEEKERNQK